MTTAATPDAATVQARKAVADDRDYAQALAAALERELASEPLRRVMRVWNVSKAKTAAMFQVSRPALDKWLDIGPPGDRAAQIALLDRATGLLVDHVRIDRIPAVVRRPAARLGGRSLLETALDGNLQAVHNELETTFDLRRVQP